MGSPAFLGVALEALERGEQEGAIVGPDAGLDLLQTADLGADPLPLGLSGKTIVERH